MHPAKEWNKSGRQNNSQLKSTPEIQSPRAFFSGKSSVAKQIQS
jgi:hypothetical protein